jgi:hypothetical protein
MAQFVAKDPRIEVSGKSVLSIVGGMGAFKTTAAKILAENGIDEPEPGRWYKQQDWLNAFKQITENIGERVLFQMGKDIIARANLPGEVTTISEGLTRLDIGYHKNHRIDGQVLIDSQSGGLLKGIGSYQVNVTAERSVEVRVDSPLPCEFDKGAITAIAEKYQPDEALFVTVEHGGSCRKNGAEACVYSVTW